MDVSGSTERQQQPAQTPEATRRRGQTERDCQDEGHFRQSPHGRFMLLEMPKENVANGEYAQHYGSLKPERICSPHLSLGVAGARGLGDWGTA